MKIRLPNQRLLYLVDVDIIDRRIFLKITFLESVASTDQNAL